MESLRGAWEDYVDNAYAMLRTVPRKTCVHTTEIYTSCACWGSLAPARISLFLRVIQNQSFV